MRNPRGGAGSNRFSRESSMYSRGSESHLDHYDNLWCLCERFVLEKEILYKLFSERGRAEVKDTLLKKLLELDLKNCSSKLKLARSLLEEIVKALKLTGSCVLVVNAKLRYKGLFGSSQGLGESVFEVGLSWDPLLDLPFIPGSSFKGAVRSFCFNLLVSRKVEAGRADELCSVLFGNSGESGGFAGTVSFLDALPISPGARGGVLSPEVLNPHYNALSNPNLRMELDVNPKPILHLCVDEGVKFRFIAYVPRRAENLLGSKLLRRLEELISNLKIEVAEDLSASYKAILATAFLVGGALKLGVGARTLKGYGRFEVEEVIIHAGGK